MMCMFMTLAGKNVEASVINTTLKLYSSIDCKNYFADTKSTQYRSSDTGVVRVVNKQIIGMAEGSAIVTATTGGKKSKVKVNVKNYDSYFAVSSCSVCLYPGETYVLGTGGTATKVKYTSDDNSVATIDKNGKIKGKSPGNTFVYAKSGNKKKVRCAVTVIDKANGADVIKFNAGKDLKYNKKWKIKNKKKYILAIHPGTYLPRDFEDRLDLLITRIEKYSKCKMNPSKDAVRVLSDKPVIWAGGRMDTCSDYYGVTINAAEVSLKNSAALVVGRFIANCIIDRGSTYRGDILGSYCGIPIARQAIKGTVLVDSCYDLDSKYIETYDENWAEITAEQVNKYLTVENLQSDIKSEFTVYLYNTYGAAVVNKIINKINAENKKIGVTGAGGIGINSKRILAICKKYTSPDVVSDYVKYFKERAVYSMGPTQDVVVYKAKNGDVIPIYPKGYGLSEYCSYGATGYEGTVTYDFTEAMKYFSLNCGQKVTGIYGVSFCSGDGNVTLKLYDSNNQLLNTITDRGSICVEQDKATKIEVTGDTGYNGFMLYYYMTNFNKYAKQVDS